MIYTNLVMNVNTHNIIEVLGSMKTCYIVCNIHNRLNLKNTRFNNRTENINVFIKLYSTTTDLV